MIERIITIFTFLAGIAFYFFNKGKVSVEINENKDLAENVEKKNKIIEDVSKLSDSDLDSKLHKWKKPKSK